MQTTEYDFESRYSGNYETEKRYALQLTRGQCCLCSKRATNVHHTFYTHGRDQALVNIFPLCDEHHSKTHIDGAHHPLNWDNKGHPAQSRNTQEYQLKLNLAVKKFLPVSYEIGYTEQPRALIELDRLPIEPLIALLAFVVIGLICILI